MNKRRFLSWLLLSALLLILYPSVAFANDETTVRYAHGFQVEKKGDLSLVTVTNPWQGANTAFQYLLKPRGTTTPKEYSGYQVVDVPIKSFIALSSTFIGYIEQLELVDKLVGFSDLHQIHSTQLKEAGKNKQIVEVGRPGNLQVETVLDLQPDIIFSFATGSFRDAHPKLIEAGLTVGVIGEYMEEHPLGRAEWIKFLALFAGKEAKAEKIFNQLEKRYLKLTEKVKEVQQRPTVITNTPFSGRWYVAGGSSYVGNLLHDAGADYIFKETDYSGAKPMDIELVYERGVEAEFWLNPGVWKSLEQARNSDPRFNSFTSLEKKRLYNNNKRVNSQGGNDYWESGIMSPDVILADLIAILHPDLLPDHQLVYYTHLQ